MTTDTEALRAQFEKLLSDSGRACLYEGDGQYGYPQDFAWICFQAGHAAAKAADGDGTLTQPVWIGLSTPPSTQPAELSGMGE